MTTANDLVKRFFEGIERNSNSLDLALVDAQYADVFMFADPSGARAIEKQKFLAALPRRRDYFEKLGHKSTRVQSLEEIPLDENYIQVRAHFLFRFEPTPGRSLEVPLESLFILYKQNDSLKIVFHLESEDVGHAMQRLGLLPQ